MGKMVMVELIFHNVLFVVFCTTIKPTYKSTLLYGVLCWIACYYDQIQDLKLSALVTTVDMTNLAIFVCYNCQNSWL